ncbi:MAG: serine/threonine protein kinase [Clostridiales bacterium]|nr:serine/threonine protein kinase [Clostridiales bacterium]
MGCMKLVNEDSVVCPFCGYRQGQGSEENYFLPPETILIGRYIVGKALGSGGFGITYIGYDGMLNRAVAIKEYFPSGLVSRKEGTKNVTTYSGAVGGQYHTGLDSFMDEAKRLAIFTGTLSIVDIYDCFLENGTGYIVMELLEGKTLREHLTQNRRMSYEQAEPIILAILGGLEAVHRKGIVHRDIAPDNIYLTASHQVKLIDFGAARAAVVGDARSISVMLKPGYAPAEQYSTHGHLGPWTDIYAVGATFYRMLTGERPEDSPGRAIEDHLVPPSRCGVSIPPEKERILMQSMAVKWDQRIPSAGEYRRLLMEAERNVYQKGPGNIYPGEAAVFRKQVYDVVGDGLYQRGGYYRKNDLGGDSFQMREDGIEEDFEDIGAEKKIWHAQGCGHDICNAGTWCPWHIWAADNLPSDRSRCRVRNRD